MIDVRSLPKAEHFSGRNEDFTEVHFTFKSFACMLSQHYEDELLHILEFLLRLLHIHQGFLDIGLE